MSDQAAGDNFEDIIRRALAPVEPPDDLGDRVEMTLWSLTEMAVDELESWELSSMRDPRNWVRPVAAIAVGTAAGAGLIVLRLAPPASPAAQRARGRRRCAASSARAGEAALRVIRGRHGGVRSR